MLYKKYHRNFVSQFKKGTKIEIYNDDIYATNRFINSEVIKEPFINHDFVCWISIVDSFNYSWVVVYHSGKISYRINIKEDAI